MIWRVIEHKGFSVVAVQDFKTKAEAIAYKGNYDKNHRHPYWVSIHYCNRDDVAYYSNA